MSEIADFLEVQYAKREKIARSAQPGPWSMDENQRIYAGDDGYVTAPWTEDERDEDLDHVALNDPAYVLADIASKRAIAKMFTPPEREPETDEQQHARYAHPAYEYATTEGQRKAWDAADDPPWGDDGPDYTWERNVDAGRDGWERFDYTEESYWRRRLPEGQERAEGEPLVLRILAAPFSAEPGYDAERWAV